MSEVEPTVRHMSRSGIEGVFETAIQRFGDSERRYGIGYEARFLALVDVARALAVGNDLQEAYALLIANIPLADRHLGPGHATAWAIRHKAVRYCDDDSERLAAIWIPARPKRRALPRH